MTALYWLKYDYCKWIVLLAAMEEGDVGGGSSQSPDGYGWMVERNSQVGPKLYTPAACGSYLLEVPDTVVAAEAFLLTIDQQEMVGWCSAG